MILPITGLRSLRRLVRSARVRGHPSSTKPSAPALPPVGTRPSVPAAPAVGHLPSLVTERLDQLRIAHPEEAVAIGALLGAASDVQPALLDAAATPPSWLEAAPSAVWVAVAEIADRYLAFDASRLLFTEAATRPGAMMASSLARASMSARNAGDAAGAEDLLAEARAVDATDADVVFAQVFLEDDLQTQLELLTSMTEPTDLRQRWFRQIAIAQHLIADRRFPEADRALDAADELRPGTFMSRTFRSLNVLAVNVDIDAEEEQPVDRAGLRAAAEELLNVRRDLLEVGRTGDGGLHRANAARALAVAGDEQRARDLLFRELTEVELTAVIEAGHTELAVAAGVDPLSLTP